MKWQVMAELSNFQGEMAHEETSIKLSQNVDMTYIIDQSSLGGEFQQGGFLYNQWHLVDMHLRTCRRLTGLKKNLSKNRPINFYSNGVVIDDENCSLP